MRNSPVIVKYISKSGEFSSSVFLNFYKTTVELSFSYFHMMF